MHAHPDTTVHPGSKPLPHDPPPPPGWVDPLAGTTVEDTTVGDVSAAEKVAGDEDR